MELDEEESIIEVLHEFLVVNPFVAINVSNLHDCNDFAVAKFNR